MPATAPVEKRQQKIARFIQAGQLRDAIKLLAPMCKKHPEHTQNWLTLASLYGQTGDFQNVVNACQRALDIRPDLPVAHSLMGNAYASLGRADEAQQQYQHALRWQPDDPGVLNNLGNSLYIAEKLEEARDILQRVVEAKPAYADAHNNLGNVYKALNDNELAIYHYQRAVQINPELSKAHLNLGDIFIARAGHPEAAEHHYRAAARIDPADIDALAGLANVLRYLGRLDEALAVIHQIRSLHASEEKALAAEADILERQGDHDGAYKIARQLAEDASADPMAADVLMRVCARFDGCEEAVRHAEALLQNDAVKPAGRETLHFGLGRLYDRLGDFENAFRHYRAGNSVFDIPFDPTKHSERIARLKRAFDADKMALLPRSSQRTGQPIFIVGMPRSGTSLTEQILASHPEVSGAGELNEINDIIATIPTLIDSNDRYPECTAALTTSILDNLAQRYLDKLNALANGKSHVTDKMPHNFMNLGMISLLFPNSRVIHCIRDPRDTCLSIYFQNFGWVHPYGTRLDWLGDYYREYASLMRHWASVATVPILDIHYENMVEDQAGTTRKILEFCGLPWHDACLQFHNSERVVATASYDQVRQKLYARSRARWKHYDNHIQPLVEALGDTLDSATAPDS